MLPRNTTTIEEFVASKSATKFAYKDFSFLDNIYANGTQIATHNTINDYINEIRHASVLVKLNDKEFRKYMYKPKLLSYDIYGNPELYFIILLINDMADVKEFCSNTFYMPRKKDMQDIVTNIYNIERLVLKEYNNHDN